jgi:diacylglycerol kinase family enzyme
MRLEVLVNGGAGAVDKAGDEAETAAIELAMEGAGIEAEVSVIDPSHLKDRIRNRWAAEDRPDAIVVAGGDGTVNAAAEVAAGTDIVIGVLPLGTFNHFAKDLGMPADLDEAARSFAGAEVRTVDVGEVNGHVFVNNSLLGVYPAMVASRDHITDKTGWGKFRAVPVAAVRALRHLPVHRLDLTGPGYERHRTRTPFVFVGNGIYDNHGSGVHGREDLGDGLLGVSVARVVSRWGLVRTVARAVLSGSQSARDLDTVELTELTIRGHTRRLRVSLDGEICWLDLPLRYRVRPNALHVLAPVPPVDPEPTDPNQVTAET